jgi:2-methylisocitrate lyase-like PEP mutase family enzyme
MNGDDLRARLAQGTPVLMPGVWDALSARLVVLAGFDTAFVSGFCVSGTRLGVPDFGYLTQTEMAETGGRVATASPELMVLIDADTGYGNALNVMRTVELYESAGAVGLFLEDQVWPKKCGHMAGKQVVPRDDWLAKLRAAVQSRTHLHITARTDARAAVDLADAIDRAKAAADVGVDALFVEAPQSMAELEQIARALTPVGATPRRQHDREGPDTAADAGRTARPRILPHRRAPLATVRRHEGNA